MGDFPDVSYLDTQIERLTTALVEAQTDYDILNAIENPTAELQIIINTLNRKVTRITNLIKSKRESKQQLLTYKQNRNDITRIQTDMTSEQAAVVQKHLDDIQLHV